MRYAQFLKDMMQSAVSAQKTITSAKLAAEGWGIEFFSDDVLSPLSYYYVHDLPTGWTWMCAVPGELAVDLANKVMGDPSLWEDVRSMLGDLIYSKATGQAVSALEGMNWETQLAAAVTAYSGTTKVLEYVGGPKPRQHFIVMNYRKLNERNSLLRPVLMPAERESVIPHDTLEQALIQIEESDRQRNPHWFK